VLEHTVDDVVAATANRVSVTDQTADDGIQRTTIGSLGETVDIDQTAAGICDPSGVPARRRAPTATTPIPR
jgi:hypothetical protein